MTDKTRHKLQTLIDEIPDSYLPQVYDIVKSFVDNDFELLNEKGEIIPSKADLKAIMKAKQEYENNEVYTFEEVFGDRKAKDSTD